MIRAILAQRQERHDPLFVAKSQWREFFRPTDEQSAWRTRLWFDDGSSETRRMSLEDVRECLKSALTESDPCSVIEVYDFDAFRTLAGPLAVDIQWA